MKPTRPKARPSDRPSMPGDEMPSNRAMTETSPRPKARPADLMEKREGATVERANRMKEREDREMNFAEGGKVKSFPDLNKDGKVSKADVLRGRGVDGFAEGGMVRGCKPGQMSGKKFSGTY